VFTTGPMSQDPAAPTCSICFDKVDEDKGTLQCGHVFCFSCISTWAKQGSTLCPQCRARFTKIVRQNADGQVKTTRVAKRDLHVEPNIEPVLSEEEEEDSTEFIEMDDMSLFNDEDDDDYEENSSQSPFLVVLISLPQAGFVVDDDDELYDAVTSLTGNLDDYDEDEDADYEEEEDSDLPPSRRRRGPQSRSCVTSVFSGA